MRTFLILVIGLLIGCTIGGVAVGLYMDRLFRDHALEQALGSVLLDVGTLTRLRNQEYDALIREREFSLSLELAMIWSVHDIDSLSARDRKILIRAVRYRTKYSYATGDLETDQKVEELLAEIERLSTDAE
jgi:hypothetical protein